jgi:hypothetical protein
MGILLPSAAVEEVERLPAPAGPGGQADAGRSRRIAKARRRARLLDYVPQLGVLGAAVAIVAATVASAVDFSNSSLPKERSVEHLADLGATLLGVGLAGALGFAVSSWRQPEKRRTLGILWDIGTFWPRATHPFGPPCYGERALPQLQNRLGYLAEAPDADVVVAAHSQGSVIAVAALLMPYPPTLQVRLSLVTYGSPLRRLYGRAFSSYFGSADLDRMRNRIGGRWYNLYRLTDPVGGWVDSPVDEVHAPAFGPGGARRAGVDVVLVDPVYGCPPGDQFPRAPRAHSHYRDDPTYGRAVEEVTAVKTS